MPDFGTTLTKGAGITVFEPQAAPTAGGAGSAVPSAAVAVMSRGPVGKPFRVTGADFEKICGKPLPMREGVHAEGLRQIADALNGSQYVDLVRVAPSDAKFPVLDFMIDPDTGNDEAVATNALGFDADVAPQANAWLTIWPINGDSSENIKVVISNVDAAAKTFELSFVDTSGVSDVQVGKTIKASIDPLAKDDNGLSMYLPSYLEDNAMEYDCIVDPAADLSKTGVLEATFTGGTGGDISTLVAADYEKAWDLLNSKDLGWKAGFAAGIYEASVLAKANAICEARMAEFRYDAPPWMTQKQAVAWMATDAPNGWLARGYHYNYKANDPYYGGKSVWGISGAQTANKAKCVAKPTSSASVSGWLYVPAGEDDGRLGRGGVAPLHYTDMATPDELFDARLNTTEGGIYVNDCLATHLKDDDLKLESTGAVISAMAYDMANALSSVRFSPASQTQTALQDLADEIVQRYLDSGSLVQPNSLDAPYQILVTQPESDYWHVEISLKVGGTTRRIAVQFYQAK